MINQFSDPYSTAGKIGASYVLILTFSNRRWEEGSL
jgi:hypothetical protein